MTFRGCYDKIFDTANPSTLQPPDHSFCTMGETTERYEYKTEIVVLQSDVVIDYTSATNYIRSLHLGKLVINVKQYLEVNVILRLIEVFLIQCDLDIIT
uniref:Uncharacterized protein n=1 Tax=Heterorhabditis bacteriophora TaxID=37862 RepID=A0A1I7XM79_HETBA